MTQAAISFQDVQKVYRTDRRAVTAIEALSFEVSEGEYVCMLGRSGCGKSTTVNLVLGLSRATAGRIRVRGVDPVDDFGKLRGKVACVFQTDRLLPWRSIIDNVRLPQEILNISDADMPIRASDWLRRLDLPGVEKSLPHELSGGMRQRVAIARALASNPEILLADEAFGHLDEVTGQGLRRDFRQLAVEHGKTVLHITHSIEEAIAVSDRIIVLARPGKVLAEIGEVRSVGAQSREELRLHILALLRQRDESESGGLCDVRGATSGDPPIGGIE